MLFSRIYRIFKNCKIHTITFRFARDCLKILNFDTKNLSPPTVFELEIENYLVQLIPNKLLVLDFWITSSILKYADNYVLYARNCDKFLN